MLRTPERRLWHQKPKTVHKIVFWPTPLPQTAHGCLPDLITSAFLPVTITLVLTTFTFILLPTITCLQSKNFCSASSLISAGSTKSSALSSSQISSPLHLFVASSVTKLNTRGLRAELWCTPTFIGGYKNACTKNLLLNVYVMYQAILKYYLLLYFICTSQIY